MLNIDVQIAFILKVRYVSQNIMTVYIKDSLF